MLVTIRIGLLAMLSVLPVGQGAGHGEGTVSWDITNGADDPSDASADRVGEPTLPTLAVPEGGSDVRTLSPQVLADLFTVPRTRPPSWASTWHGVTPETEPVRAAELSRASPAAYADWLRSTLPPGSTIERRWAVVTAYCPCAICCDQRTGRTATGRDTDLHPYGIAADWRLLRRGTLLHVPGYLTESTVGGAWEVDDTGGALRRARDHGVLHIDVRYVSHWWAERWGTRRMWIYLVGPPADVAADSAAAAADR